MNDWNSWQDSRETRHALKKLEEQLKELENLLISGSLIIHDSADRIAVDYAHKIGILEGFREAVQTIKDLPKEEEDSDERV